MNVRRRHRGAPCGYSSDRARRVRLQRRMRGRDAERRNRGRHAQERVSIRRLHLRVNGQLTIRKQAGAARDGRPPDRLRPVCVGRSRSDPASLRALDRRLRALPRHRHQHIRVAGHRRRAGRRRAWRSRARGRRSVDDVEQLRGDAGRPDNRVRVRGTPGDTSRTRARVRRTGRAGSGVVNPSPAAGGADLLPMDGHHSGRRLRDR